MKGCKVENIGLSPLKLGKIKLSSAIVFDRHNEAAMKTLGLYIQTLEKIISKEFVILICKSEHFREMTLEDKMIPNYTVRIEKNDIMQTYNITFLEEVPHAAQIKKPN